MKNKVTVLRIAHRLSVSGPTHHIAILSSKLDTDKYNTFLMAGQLVDGETSGNYILQNYGVNVDEYLPFSRNFNPIGDLVSLFRIVKFIRANHIDIIHTHAFKSGLIGRIAGLICGVPKIYHTYHGNVFEGYFNPIISRVIIRLEELLSRFTTKVVVISQQQLEEVGTALKLSSDKLRLIPLGFDLNKFYFVSQDERDNSHLKDSPKRLNLLLVGRLTYIKNQIDFIRLVENLFNTGLDIEGTLVGTGEDLDLLKDYVNKVKLNERIHFLGHQSDMNSILGHADFVVLTSLNEGTPVSIIEAITAGKFCLAYNVGGVRDLITDNVNGKLFPKGDYSGMSEWILENGLTHRNLDYSLTKESRMLVSKYNFKNLIKNLEQLYEE